VNLHRLDLVSLSLFSLIARTGSISKGSALAHLAVGAASKRMSDLEAAVGAELFERHSRGVTLTVAGAALQRHAQRILSDVDHLEADLSDHAHGLVGVVRLWVNTSAVTQFLPQQFSTFVAANPGIRIELEERNSAEVVVAVLDGRADIGIFADRVPALGLQIVGYRDDRLVLVAPKAHPLAARKRIDFIDATEFDFVSLSSGTSLSQRLHAEAEAMGKSLRVRIRVRSFDAICHMVAAGLGIAVLPLVAVQPHLRSMGLAKADIRDDFAHRSLLLGARDFAALPRPARRLAEHLRTDNSPPAGPGQMRDGRFRGR